MTRHAVVSPSSVSAPSVRPSPGASTAADAPRPPTHPHRRSPRRPASARAVRPLAGVAWTSTASTTCSQQRRRHRRRGDRRRRAGGRLDPRGAAGRQVGGHRQQAGDRAPRRGAADARRAPGTQLRFEARSAARCRSSAPLGDGLAGDRITRIDAHPERHHQRRAVADGGHRLLDRRGAALTPVRAGYAEADPSADLDGDDAAREARDPLRAGVRPARGPDGDRHARRPRRSTAADFARARGARRHDPPDRARRIRPRDVRRSTAWVAPVVVPRDSIFATHDRPAERRAHHRRPRRRDRRLRRRRRRRRDRPSPSSATSSPSRAIARPSCRRRGCLRLHDFRLQTSRASDFRLHQTS